MQVRVLPAHHFPMNTDTPRTDALEFKYATSGGGWGKPFDFARELERELNEQCRLNGKGSEREAALLGKVERLERECREMRSLLLRIHSARVGMNEEAVIAALNDVDAFFREPNHN